MYGITAYVLTSSQSLKCSTLLFFHSLTMCSPCVHCSGFCLCIVIRKTWVKGSVFIVRRKWGGKEYLRVEGNFLKTFQFQLLDIPSDVKHGCSPSLSPLFLLPPPINTLGLVQHDMCTDGKINHVTLPTYLLWRRNCTLWKYITAIDCANVSTVVYDSI